MKSVVYEFPDKKKLTLGDKPLIMGILNLTPDSFYDGGRYSEEAAINRAKELIDEGADIIDLGAESTRPGGTPVSAEEERLRLVPALEKILKITTVPVSIDTYRAETAETALKMGAHIINDVDFDENMAKTMAKHNAPVIVMARNTMGNAKNTVHSFSKLIKIATDAGVLRENIILDPGIGFIGGAEADLAAMANLEFIKEVDGREYPLLVGVSRKSFIGKVTGKPVEKRLAGTLAANALAAEHGADILRVHDVGETRDAIMMVREIGLKYGRNYINGT